MDFTEDELEEARHIYEAADETRVILNALHTEGVTPDDRPDVWGDLKGALEAVRVRAEMNPAFAKVVDGEVANSPSGFLEQVAAVDDFDDALVDA